jgi:hypothetical protein
LRTVEPAAGAAAGNAAEGAEPTVCGVRALCHASAASKATATTAIHFERIVDLSCRHLGPLCARTAAPVLIGVKSCLGSGAVSRR